MATKRDERSSPVPEETVFDGIHGDASVPPTRPDVTVAEETGIYAPVDDAQDGSDPAAAPNVEPLRDRPAREQAPKPAVPPSARPPARNQSSGPATEKMEGTDRSLPATQAEAQWSGLELTPDDECAAEPTIKIAATGVFEPGSTDAESPPRAGGRPDLPL